MSTEFYPMKGVVCSLKHQKIDAWVSVHSEEIGWLLVHAKEVGHPYESVQDLIVDLLDDIIDVEVDAHRKNDSCLFESPPEEVDEETVRNAPPVDSYRIVSDTGE